MSSSASLDIDSVRAYLRANNLAATAALLDREIGLSSHNDDDERVDFEQPQPQPPMTRDGSPEAPMLSSLKATQAVRSSRFTGGAWRWALILTLLLGIVLGAIYHFDHEPSRVRGVASSEILLPPPRDEAQELRRYTELLMACMNATSLSR
jgi:hypothetical protein